MTQRVSAIDSVSTSTVLAARIGTACTEVKPASVAAAANCGHRAASDCMSATEIGCPVA